jgi:regulator of protease activity HflC (stomatin/prohibitin superfamily)
MDSEVKFGLKVCAWATAAVVTAVVALNSYTLVEVGEEKAGSVWGKVNSTAYSPGVHVVNPLMDFETYNTLDVTHTWDNLGVPAQDKMKTSLDVAVTGHFVKGMSPFVRSTTGDEEAFLRTHYMRRVPAAVVEVGKGIAINSEDFLNSTTIAEMQVGVKSLLNSELEDLGYVITSIKFSDINLPPVIRKSVEETLKRKQEVQRQEQQLLIKQLEADELTAVAEAADNSATFNASAKKKAADAELYRITKVAAGNEKLAKSVTPALIKLKEAEAKLLWNGVMPQTMLGEGTNVLMNMK